MPNLVRGRIAVAPLLGRVGIGIEAFIDDDPLLIEEDRTQDIGTDPVARGTLKS
jgi:hypothetical protein